MNYFTHAAPRDPPRAGPAPTHRDHRTQVNAKTRYTARELPFDERN